MIASDNDLSRDDSSDNASSDSLTKSVVSCRSRTGIRWKQEEARNERRRAKLRQYSLASRDSKTVSV